MGAMTVSRNGDRWLPGNVRLAGSDVAACDKQAPHGFMTHADYGIGAFRAAAFDNAAGDRPVRLSDIHRAMIARGMLYAFPAGERWCEIGSPEGLAETKRFIRARPVEEMERP